ncbi:unnamed protein product [Haemonchus placei]|uniref:Uncharacterized protein n=1 Tax=Haemonchus placei TaxID=6290 RepID=A0A0N4X920_HAEPC|nr:unnamed protein product [Haemonchus placei]
MNRVPHNNDSFSQRLSSFFYLIGPNSKNSDALDLQFHTFFRMSVDVLAPGFWEIGAYKNNVRRIKVRYVFIECHKKVNFEFITYDCLLHYMLNRALEIFMTD